MLAKSHVPIAVASWCALATVLAVPVVPILAAIPLAALGGLLPDIDHPGSWLGRKLPGVSHLIRFVLGHRGGTHSLLALGLCAWGLVTLVLHGTLTETTLSSVSGTMAAALLVGFVSHLGADGVTKRGVPLLWPSQRSFRTPIALTTGSWVETMVTGLYLAGMAVLLARHYGLMP